MKFVEAITQIMTAKQIRKADLARRRGIRPQSVNTLFSDQKSVSLEVAAETARVMDYRIALVPCDAKLPRDSFELEG